MKYPVRLAFGLSAIVWSAAVVTIREVTSSEMPSDSVRRIGWLVIAVAVIVSLLADERSRNRRGLAATVGVVFLSIPAASFYSAQTGEGDIGGALASMVLLLVSPVIYLAATARGPGDPGAPPPGRERP